jgi:DNA-binding transcriptional ArsR family regulator
MVEQVYDLDAIFGSLSNPIRRDMLALVSKHDLSVNAIAKNYRISLAGVAKHLTVLQHASLIRKTRNGKQQIIAVDPVGLEVANDVIGSYRQLWNERLFSLDTYLQSTNKNGDLDEPN